MSQQPSTQTSNEVRGNPASKEPAEKSNAKAGGQGGSQVEQRHPSQQTSPFKDATPTSQGQGVRGGGSGENPSNVSAADKGQSHVDDADEQISAPGEGKVASAVKGSSGGGNAGQQGGTESELDRKKAEQAPQREKMKQEGRKEVDVGGVLGQRAAPADPSD